MMGLASSILLYCLMENRGQGQQLTPVAHDPYLQLLHTFTLPHMLSDTLGGNFRPRSRWSIRNMPTTNSCRVR